MKENYEGDEFTSSFFVGDHKILAKEDGVFNGDKEYFGSDPNEEHRSNMKSLFELPNEVEDKPPPVGCELEKLKEELMQRNENNSYFCTPLHHDEVAAT